MSNFHVICGDALTELRKMPSGSVDCCVTSPPYYGLRNYGIEGQIGLEKSPEAYVARLVEVFREVRRVLANDGTLWLNLGDSYAAGKTGRADADRPNGSLHAIGSRGGNSEKLIESTQGAKQRPVPCGLKPKDLIGIPWRMAFALQADGWYLRSDIIWAKDNPMPESVTDRPTRSHEYIFLFAKSERYYYDHESVKEPAVSTHSSGNGFKRDCRLSYSDENGPRGNEQQWRPTGRGGVNAFPGQGHFREGLSGPANREGRDMRDVGASDSRNKRDVWHVSTKPYPEAHFATFPEELIAPCILAGCREGGVVVDPFSGAGTTGVVALKANRNFIGIELNPKYVAMARRRLHGVAPLIHQEVDCSLQEKVG